LSGNPSYIKREENEADALQVFFALVQDDLNKVNHDLYNLAKSRAELAVDVSSHILKSGGKRIRPALTIACAKLCDYTQGERAVNMAATVELIHTATLLHDDVVDKSGLRRGEPSANRLWGDKESVLVGDFLFAKAFRLMVEDGSPQVLDTLSAAASEIIEGEILQLSTNRNIRVSLEQYIEVIRSKTARLFAAACKVGALVAGDSRKAELLEQFGMNLGLAFQIIDDAMDYSVDRGSMGKEPGDDMREGKMTLPVIIAYAYSNEEDKRFWFEMLENGSVDEYSFARARSIIDKHSVMDEVNYFAETYAEKARQNLRDLPDSPYKAALLGLVNFCINRNF